MAPRTKLTESEETKEAKTASKTSKKIATGSTKKMVQKRSSSVASKKTPTKTVEEKPSTKKTTTKKTTTSKAGASKTPAKKSTTKKTTTKVVKAKETETTPKKTPRKTTKTKPEIEQKIDVFENETKEVFSSIIKATNQDIEKERAEASAAFLKDIKKTVDLREAIRDDEKEEPTKKDLSLKEMAQIQEEVKKEMKANRKLPEVEISKMSTRIFQNILLAIVIMLYFNFIILGFMNIENSVFLVDLKVFSVGITAISLITIEHAYRKKSGKHAIHGIETLILALLTMALIYINLTWAGKFVPIAMLMAYLFAIYYVIKSTIVYRKMKKQYFVQSMKEMIKK